MTQPLSHGDQQVAGGWTSGEPAVSGADAGLDLVTLGGVPRLLVPRDIPASFRRSAFGLLQGLRPPQSWLWAAASRGWALPIRRWPVRVQPTTLERTEHEQFVELVDGLERW